MKPKLPYHKSDSSVQRASEPIALKSLNANLNLNLASKLIDLPNGTRVQLDGVDIETKVACEIYSRIGKLKGSQPDKLASDILKLILVEQHYGGNWRKIICFLDEEAKKSMTNKSWLASTREVFDIEVVIVDISDAIRQSLLDAQEIQKMVNIE